MPRGKKKDVAATEVAPAETINMPVGSGFEQTYVNKEGKTVKLKDFLKEGDWWELKKNKHIVYIVLHDTVKRLADEVGILTDVQYSILTQPTYENNYQQTWQVRIVDHTGRATTEIGETNRSNLGPRGRGNPANMSQKRAYDRAVFRHLGITGFLGETELDEEPEKIIMDKLTPEQSQQIAPLLNELLAAKTRLALEQFNKAMKTKAKDYIPEQLNVLRGMWKKKLAEITKSTF